MNLDAHHPGLPDRYTPEWEGQLVADMSFAPAAEVLLLNGRVEEARTLCEAGVVAHPFYATGHLLLGRAYLAESRWDDARLELERALQLDGSYPAILENLAACYEQLGLTDLAQGCHALGRDLDPRPLTRDEDEGGPEMVDDLDKRSEEGGEPEEESLEEVPGAVNLDDIGSPEDALKELEALLEGTDSSSESEEAKAEPVPEPVTEEVDLPAEEPEIEPAPEPAGAIDLDASLEGGEPPAGEEEDAEKAELWKKIMDQAEQAEGGDYQSMEDLEQIVAEGDASEVEEEETPEEEAPVEIGAIDLDASAAETEEPVEVEQMEGLEVSEPGAADVEPEMLEGLEVSAPGGELTDADTAEQIEEAVETVEIEPLSPEDLSLHDIPEGDVEGVSLDELGKELEGTLESFEEAPGEEETAEVEPIGDDDTLSADEEPVAEPEPVASEEPAAPEEPIEAEPEVAADLDLDEVSTPEDALAALEAELSGDEPAAEEPEAEEPTDLDTELAEVAAEAEEAETASAEAAPEEPALEQLEEPALEEEPELEEAPAPAAPAEAEAAPPGEGAIGEQINTTEDSIRVAIKAEILVAQGKRQEALKLFEALHLWDPDRASIKERVEELRKQPTEL